MIAFAASFFTLTLLGFILQRYEFWSESFLNRAINFNYHIGSPLVFVTAIVNYEHSCELFNQSWWHFSLIVLFTIILVSIFQLSKKGVPVIFSNSLIDFVKISIPLILSVLIYFATPYSFATLCIISIILLPQMASFFEADKFSVKSIHASFTEILLSRLRSLILHPATLAGCCGLVIAFTDTELGYIAQKSLTLAQPIFLPLCCFVAGAKLASGNNE